MYIKKQEWMNIHLNTITEGLNTICKSKTTHIEDFCQFIWVFQAKHL